MLKLELSCPLLAFVLSFGLRLVWSSGISEPEGDPETTMSTAEQPESETEPASEFESPFSESENVIAETRPSVAEFLLPPFVLIFIIVTALGGLMVTAQWRKRKRKRKQEEREITEAFVNSGFDVDTEKIEAKKPIEPPTKFITRADLKVIDSLDSFFNQPMQLLKISLPAVLSLAFCPLLLQIYGPLTRFFWPASQYPNGMPPINEAIACFLAPAGLVYAVTFGFTFQSAVEKQKALLNNVSLEVSLLDQIIILASQVPLSDESDRVEIYRAVKDEIISIMQQIQIQSKRSGFNLQNGPLWKIVPIIRKRRYNNQADTVMAKEMIKHLLKMNTARSERHEAMSASIHPLQWFFLEVLSFFSFFGVLLIKADSYRMELTMCIVTVFSISLLCYVVADLDSPFSGFFRVNLSFLSEILKKTEIMYETENDVTKTSVEDTAMVAVEKLNQTNANIIDKTNANILDKALTPNHPFMVQS